ncbi:MAG: tetratricopeptide repeat protein [Burkholderiaceae bacterium]
MSLCRVITALVLSISLWPAWADALQDGVAAMQRKDYPAAYRLLEPLARSGNPAAQLHLGLLYYHGHGVRESDVLALQWFERAARQGLAEAQFHLGNMYAYGLADPGAGAGANANRLAAQWIFEAARQGHAQAQYSLGIMFLTGTGVVQDEAEAKRWIGRAAAQGHADAAAYLKGNAP